MRPWPLLLLALAAAGPSAALAAAAAEPEPTITKPDWERIPSGDDMVAVSQSFPKSDSGSAAVLFCSVNAKRLLEGCRVISQYPDRSDVGAAALKLSHSFRLKPKTKEGKDVVGGTIRIPFNFANLGTHPVAGSIQNPAWAKTPALAEITSAFPPGHADVDKVQLSYLCATTKTGRLSNCILTSSEPQHLDFERAGRTLTPLFELSSDAGGKPPPARARVVLDIQLSNPAKPAPPPMIGKPAWWTFPSESAVLAAFPAKAREAKVATGRAILDCTTDHEGRLGNCSATEQGSQGLGFDEAALNLVDKMRIVPWLPPGVPTEGAKLRFLMRMDDAPPLPAPPN